MRFLADENFPGDAVTALESAAGAARLLPAMTKKFEWRALDRPPEIRLLFIVQMSDSRDMRRVPLSLGPTNCFFLRSESAKQMIGMIFDDVVVDWASVRTPLGTGFDVNDCHCAFSR
jgi:hypothetical protein